MPKMIANRSMYYAGTRAAGESFEVPEPMARVLAHQGKARYVTETQTRRRYKRRDLRAET